MWAFELLGHVSLLFEKNSELLSVGLVCDGTELIFGKNKNKWFDLNVCFAMPVSMSML